MADLGRLVSGEGCAPGGGTALTRLADRLLLPCTAAPAFASTQPLAHAHAPQVNMHSHAHLDDPLAQAHDHLIPDFPLHAPHPHDVHFHPELAVAWDTAEQQAHPHTVAHGAAAAAALEAQWELSSQASPLRHDLHSHPPPPHAHAGHPLAVVPHLPPPAHQLLMHEHAHAQHVHQQEHAARAQAQLEAAWAGSDQAQLEVAWQRSGSSSGGGAAAGAGAHRTRMLPQQPHHQLSLHYLQSQRPYARHRYPYAQQAHGAFRPYLAPTHASRFASPMQGHLQPLQQPPLPQQQAPQAGAGVADATAPAQQQQQAPEQRAPSEEESQQRNEEAEWFARFLSPEQQHLPQQPGGASASVHTSAASRWTQEFSADTHSRARATGDSVSAQPWEQHLHAQPSRDQRVQDSLERAWQSSAGVGVATSPSASSATPAAPALVSDPQLGRQLDQAVAQDPRLEHSEFVRFARQLHSGELRVHGNDVVNAHTGLPPSSSSPPSASTASTSAVAAAAAAASSSASSS
jgi:hypothetical protein